MSTRIPVLSRLLCGIVAAALLLIPTTADAQQFARNGNRRIGTIGDLSSGKLNPRIQRLRGLNFATLGLFGDAQVFGQFNAPRPFIFPLPDFSGAGLDFTGVSFDDYLNIVANSYRLTDSADYLLRFQFQNEVTALNPDFIPTFNQVIQAHQQDFTAGGGFLPFGAPTIPTPPVPDPEPFVPFDQVRPGDPFGPGDPTTLGDGISGPSLQDSTQGDTSTSSVGLLAAEIADATGLTLNIDTGLVLSVSQSESTDTNLTLGNWNAGTPAETLSVVPEPATLGLLVVGAGALLTRSRRR